MRRISNPRSVRMPLQIGFRVVAQNAFNLRDGFANALGLKRMRGAEFSAVPVRQWEGLHSADLQARHWADIPQG